MIIATVTVTRRAAGPRKLAGKKDTKGHQSPITTLHHPTHQQSKSDIRHHLSSFSKATTEGQLSKDTTRMSICTVAGTPAKVGTCSSCGLAEAQFSKSQWKKTAGLRKCIICVAVGETTPLRSDNKDKEYCKMLVDGQAKKANEPQTVANDNETKPAEDTIKPAAAKASPESEEDAEGNWSPLQQSDDEEAKQPPRKSNKESIRDKMKRNREDTLNTTSNKRYKTDESNEEDNNVSVERLKQQILGRSIHSYDVNSESHNFNGSQMIMDPSVFADGTTVADHLKPHLSCPVCFERLYNPVSLLCGHSFCKKCLVWWINRSNETTDDDNLQVFGTCPSCRHPIVGKNKDNLFQINTALKACLDTLFGAEMNQRRLAEQREHKKATSGENGGAHDRGCEEIVGLSKEDEFNWGKNGMKDEENGWVSLYASSDSGKGSTAHIRRNIVLDDCDQMYQISLAFNKCIISKNGNGHIVDVELCLLRMEEDEIDDSGFPTMVSEGSDDEFLICTDNDRIHTCIESSVRIAPAAAFERNKDFSCFTAESKEEKIKEVPLSRGMIGADGSVRFRIDIGRVLQDEASNDTSSMKDPKLIKLVFNHVDTGAKLELRTPSKFDADDAASMDSSEGEVEYGGTRTKRFRNNASKFVVDAFEEEDEDSNEPNAYEMDDFLVEGSQDTDDEDGCDICNQHGELIVCDGGDNEGGCGKSFHLECINRSEIPPGQCIRELLRICFNGLISSSHFVVFHRRLDL